MNLEKQRLRLGLLVLGGAALLLALLFFLGLSDLFSTRAHLVTFFTESVQGLSIGSAVKYRGVPVGTVSEITILAAEKQIRVDMEIDLKHFQQSGGKGGDPKEVFDHLLRAEMRQGLRCRLEFLGITGMKYIDFDYFGKVSETLPKEPAATRPDAVYIASVRSSFKDVTMELTKAMERLSKVRFEEISDELERALHETTMLLSDPALKSAIDRINESARNLEVGSRNISRVIDEKSLLRMRQLWEENLVSMKKLTGDLAADVREMRLPESTQALRDAADAVANSRNDISNMLLKFNAAMEAFRELCDTVNEDPSALVRGKREESHP